MYLNCGVQVFPGWFVSGICTDPTSHSTAVIEMRTLLDSPSSFETERWQGKCKQSRGRAMESHGFISCDLSLIEMLSIVQYFVLIFD